MWKGLFTVALGWRAQDLYNDYLDIKADLVTARRGYETSIYFRGDDRDEFSGEIDRLESRLRDVLDQLQLEGMDMKDLVLLSAGVEVALFN